MKNKTNGEKDMKKLKELMKKKGDKDNEEFIDRNINILNNSKGK